MPAECAHHRSRNAAAARGRDEAAFPLALSPPRLPPALRPPRATRLRYASLIAHLKASCARGSEVVWSTHCHNDLGLATANTLAAVQAGARQVEVTLNSLGERAGNTSLEEVVMAVRTRPNHYPYTLDIDTTQVRPGRGADAAAQ